MDFIDSPRTLPSKSFSSSRVLVRVLVLHLEVFQNMPVGFDPAAQARRERAVAAALSGGI